MKNVDRLVARVRRETRNEDNSNTVASDSLSDEEFIDALNDGQERLQAVISNVFSTAFEKQIVINVVSGQTDYTIDDNVYLGNRIVCVEYSPTGQDRDYIELENRDIKERNERDGLPSFYIRTATKIIINPVPRYTSSKLRVTYEKKLSTLDKKRGTISVVGSPSGGQIALTITSPDAELSNLLKGDKITILDTYGQVSINDVEVLSYSSPTLTVAEGDLVAGTNIDTNYTILIGNDAVFTPALPDVCEKYLVAYACWQILNRDDLVKASRAKDRLSLAEEEVIESFLLESKDVKYIPIFNKSFY